jgi:Flp pilus assembly protein TadG
VTGHGRGDERGVVIIIAALAMTVLLVIVALVIDLGSTRDSRSRARSAADAGATAGAFSLSTSTTSACRDAVSYTFVNLGGTQPSNGDVTSACTAFLAACTTGLTPRVATVTVGDTTVSVTNPVPNSSSLLRAEAVGGGASQNVNTANDGTECQRVAVEVTRPKAKFFGGIVSQTASTFTVHSVARYSPSVRPGEHPPALVTLDQTMCRAIDAGNNGRIVLRAVGDIPGLAYSDSDGPSCSSTNPILNSTNSANLIAESSGTTPGQLSWYSAPVARGWGNCGTCATTFGSESSHENYVGTLQARTARTTRTPADRVYHCRNVPVTASTPLCTTPDPVADALAYAASTSAPPGFTTWSGPCDSTSGVTMGAAGANIWVNCPVFSVKGGELRIAGGGTIVFNGRLSIESGGVLAVNVNNPPTLSGGSPVAATTTRQTTLVIGSTGSDAFSVQSTSAEMYLAQTTIVSRGGGRLQGSPQIHWSAPSAGSTRGLMYWSESTQPFHIQGSPGINARGVFFHGNGPLTGAGSGTIDLTNVQAWVDSTSLSGSPTLRLAPDPDNSISVSAAGSQLIR